MSSSHFIDKCRHGVVLAQCRCLGNKTVRTVPCPPSCPGDPQTVADAVRAHLTALGWREWNGADLLVAPDDPTARDLLVEILPEPGLDDYAVSILWPSGRTGVVRIDSGTPIPVAIAMVDTVIAVDRTARSGNA